MSIWGAAAGSSIGFDHETDSFPAWCVPGHEADEESDAIGPWLRLEVASPKAPNYWRAVDGHPAFEDLGVSVCLDETAARSLRDRLTEWLDYPKAYPPP